MKNSVIAFLLSFVHVFTLAPQSCLKPSLLSSFRSYLSSSVQSVRFNLGYDIEADPLVEYPEDDLLKKIIARPLRTLPNNRPLLRRIRSFPFTKPFSNKYKRHLKDIYELLKKTKSEDKFVFVNLFCNKSEYYLSTILCSYENSRSYPLCIDLGGYSNFEFIRRLALLCADFQHYCSFVTYNFDRSEGFMQITRAFYSYLDTKERLVTVEIENELLFCNDDTDVNNHLSKSQELAIIYPSIPRFQARFNEYSILNELATRPDYDTIGLLPEYQTPLSIAFVSCFCSLFFLSLLLADHSNRTATMLLFQNDSSTATGMIQYRSIEHLQDLLGQYDFAQRQRDLNLAPHAGRYALSTNFSDTMPAPAIVTPSVLETANATHIAPLLGASSAFMYLTGVTPEPSSLHPFLVNFFGLIVCFSIAFIFYCGYVHFRHLAGYLKRSTLLSIDQSCHLHRSTKVLPPKNFTKQHPPFYALSPKIRQKKMRKALTSQPQPPPPPALSLYPFACPPTQPLKNLDPLISA